jgi:hypothetical protein
MKPVDDYRLFGRRAHHTVHTAPAASPAGAALHTGKTSRNREPSLVES